MPDIHRSARSGFTQAAKSYVKGRPGYPAAVDDWLSTTLGLSPDKTVLDLGAGTGKFTTHLVKTGANIIAVEPVKPMLEELRQTLPTVDSRQGTATGIPVPDNSIDALFCAQAFHWFASPEALAEFHRVLKPGGTLGLIWNIRDERCDWVAALSRIMQPYEAGTPRFHEGRWRSVFPAKGFSDLQEQEFNHNHTGDPRMVITDRIMSVSFIAALPPDDQDEVIRKIHHLLDAHPNLKDRSEVAFPYTTLVAWTRKKRSKSTSHFAESN